MDKIENLHDLEYYGNIQVCLELALKWKKLKPDNKEIQELSRALIDISFYVIRIKKDLDANKIAVSDYRYDKNKALLQLQEIKNKYENLKKLDIN
tara:strand:+ start:46 stop:330 length:285 start_codon:yes stop_codon:yes gene_type:complete